MAFDPSSPEVSVLMVCDVAGVYRPAQAAEVLHVAQQMLFEQMRGREVLSSPQAVRDFLRVRLGGLEHEVFAVLMLDALHRLIEYVELFRGTVNQSSVYPREVVKEALARNAASMITSSPAACCTSRASRRCDSSLGLPGSQCVLAGIAVAWCLDKIDSPRDLATNAALALHPKFTRIEEAACATATQRASGFFWPLPMVTPLDFGLWHGIARSPHSRLPQQETPLRSRKQTTGQLPAASFKRKPMAFRILRTVR